MKLAVVEHACNPSSGEGEARGSEVQAHLQLRLHETSLLKNKKAIDFFFYLHLRLGLMTDSSPELLHTAHLPTFALMNFLRASDVAAAIYFVI